MSFGDLVDFNTSQAVLGQLCMGKGIFVTQSLHSEEQMDKAGIQINPCELWVFSRVCSCGGLCLEDKGIWWDLKRPPSLPVFSAVNML